MCQTHYPHALAAMCHLLQTCGEKHWLPWIADDLQTWNATQSVDHHLRAYGGAGSFTDLHIRYRRDRTWVQACLEDLRSFCYHLASHIEQPFVLSEFAESMGYAQFFLQGWRCLACGHSELKATDAERFIAAKVMRKELLDAIPNKTIDILIENTLKCAVPGADAYRSTIHAKVVASNIAWSIRGKGMQQCPDCDSKETAVYRWLAGPQAQLMPAANNLPMRDIT